MTTYKFFYPAALGDSPPESVENFCAWFNCLAKGSTLLGPAAWVVQTYVHMLRQGLPCVLTDQWPSDGVVIAHRDHLPEFWQASADRYVVCCLADRAQPHPCADLHVLQNPYQALTLGAYAYMPHWPQPGLIARDAARRPVVKNLAFFGELDNLAPALRDADFAKWCLQHGMYLTFPRREDWADYRSVDAVIAVRQFTEHWGAYDKPATKLFNAWLAGVVPIVGMESAFAGEGQPFVDCFVVRDLQSLKTQLVSLQTDAALFRGLLAAGERSGRSRSTSAIATLWSRLLSERVHDAAERQRRRGRVALACAGLMSRFRAGLAWRGHLLRHRNPSLPN